MNSEALKLVASVNGHIRKCERCLQLVRSFQMIYDEFSRMNTRCDFKKFHLDAILKYEGENIKSSKTIATHEEIDGFR